MKNKMLKNIKTIASYTLALLVIVSSLSFIPAVQAVDTPTLTIGSQVASNGANITVPISASNFANSIAGMTFNVQYDSSLLTYTGYTQNAISGHGTLAVSDPAINPIAINWFDSAALSVDSGAIITLNFTVISASVTTANLTFVGTKELSDSSDVVSSTFADGAITLNPASTIATVTSGTYTVNDGASTITNIPYGTTSSAFQNALTKGESHQTWNPAGLSNPVLTGDTLVVTAQSGATKTYTLTVALNPAKNINSFSFTTGEGVITGTDIAVTVPYGTVVTALIPTILLSGGTVSPLSGVAQDFSNPVEYTVTAADSSTKVYTVTVTVSLNTEANILSFDSTTPSTIGNISGNTITLTVPFGTSLTNLPIAITLSTGATVLPVQGNTTFVDGSAVIYTVTAQDGTTTKNYSVTATVAANTAKNITSFNFAGLTPSVTGVTGVIGENTIALTVPYSTVVSTLVPTIGITGASVSPASGATQDFSSPVLYTVTAADASTKIYTITVTIAAPSSIATVTSTTYTVGVDTIINVPFGTPKAAFQNALTKGELNQTWNVTGLADPVVTGNTLVVTAQDGTTIVTYTITVNAPSSIATVTATGTYTISTGGTATETITNIPYGTSKAAFQAALTKGEINQTWNVTGLADPVVTGNTLVVTAQDGTTIVTYTLTVKLNPAKAITGFTIPNQIGITTIDESAYTIQIIMPSDTVVNALVPTIIKTGVSVSPDTGVAQDFTLTSTYTVTAADSSTQNYLVTVSVLEDTQTAPDESGAATVDSTTPNVVITNPDQPVDLTIDPGTNNPTIDVSAFITGVTGTLPAITIDSSVADVVIPDNTVVTGPTGWNGVIDAPIKGTPSGNAPAGFSVGNNVVSVGSDAGTLFFDTPVSITLPGVTGTVGYRPAGSNTWQTIDTQCNSATDHSNISSGECYFHNGGDTIIWTYHFTSFGGLNTVVSHGGGGGGYVVPAVPATKIEGCKPGSGDLFDITSGKSCTIKATPAVPTGQVLGVAPFNFTKLMKNNSKGNEVVELQKFLNALGYTLTADGKFGAKTKGAVIKFQITNGLKGDGVVGPKVRALLNK